MLPISGSEQTLFRQPAHFQVYSDYIVTMVTCSVCSSVFLSARGRRIEPSRQYVCMYVGEG
jgi:hypothetical protein